MTAVEHIGTYERWAPPGHELPFKCVRRIDGSMLLLAPKTFFLSGSD